MEPGGAGFESKNGAPGRNRTCCLAVRSRAGPLSQGRSRIPLSSDAYQVLVPFCGRVATTAATGGRVTGPAWVRDVTRGGYAPCQGAQDWERNIAVMLA